MKKHTLPVKTSDAFIPISIAFLLVIGIFISIVQVQQPQQNKGHAQVALKNCTVSDSQSALSANEKAMFDTINNYRKENGLKELYYESNLQRSAQWMSNDMLANKSLNHTDSAGRDVSARIIDCGVTGQTSWGENIAQGYEDVAKTFEAWRASPGHNANMLGNFSHMGIAETDTYWTLDLATIPNGNTNPPPVESGVTTQPTVSVIQPSISQQPTVSPTSAIPTALPVTPTAIPTPSNPRPDLIVDDMRISTNLSTTCGPLGVLAVIKNQGPISTSAPIIVKVNNGVGTITGGLGAGQSKAIWVQNIVTSGQTVVLVDPTNSILEKDETNNQLKLFLPIPTSAPQCPTPTKSPVPTTGIGGGAIPTSTGGTGAIPTGTSGGIPTGSVSNVTPTPSTYPGFSLNPNDTQVLVSIKLPGIGINGNKSPKHQSRKVTVTVYDLENEQAVVGSAFLTYDKNDLFKGLLHLGKLPNGTYYVKVVTDHTLQGLVMPQFQPLLNTRLNVLSPVILITGELSGDNQLTIADYNLALACFQDKGCAVKPLTDANDDGTVNVYDSIDFNDDGKVDVVDYNFFLHNFKEFGGD